MILSRERSRAVSLNSILSPIGLSLKLYQIKDQIDKVIKRNKRRKERRDFVSYVQLIRLIRDELGTLSQVASNSVKFIQRIVISPDYYLNVSLTGGFTEPHITGWFYGSVSGIQPMLGKSIRLFYAPDFTKESLNGKVRGRLTVRLYSIIREVLIFFWRLPKFRLLRIYFKSRKGGRYGKPTD